jgi:RNA polymerase sigma-70 factor (ECF subfamily)
MKINDKSDKIEQILSDKYSKKVFNIAYYLTGNYHDAQDLAQEAFIKMILAIKTGLCDTNLSIDSYLYKIIRNLYIDSLRKKPKVEILSLDEPLNEIEGEGEKMELIKSSLPDPESVVEKKIQEDNVRYALKQIPLEYRMPVILCDIEGYSYKEISKILNCLEGTVRSRIHRGRKYLIKILSNISGEKK